MTAAALLVIGGTCIGFLAAFASDNYDYFRGDRMLLAILVLIIATITAIGGTSMLIPPADHGFWAYGVVMLYISAGWALHIFIGIIVLPIFGLDPKTLNRHRRYRRRR